MLNKRLAATLFCNHSVICQVTCFVLIYLDRQQVYCMELFCSIHIFRHINVQYLYDKNDIKVQYAYQLIPYCSHQGQTGQTNQVQLHRIPDQLRLIWRLRTLGAPSIKTWQNLGHEKLLMDKFAAYGSAQNKNIPTLMKPKFILKYLRYIVIIGLGFYCLRYCKHQKEE